MPLILEEAEIFTPLPGDQQGFMDDFRHRYCAAAGGWNSGKSWAGSRKHAQLHVINAFDKEGFPTRVRSMAVAQTYQLAITEMVPQLEEAFDQMGLTHEFVADLKRFLFVFPDLGTIDRPSEMLIRSADAPDRIVAFKVGAIWGDEVARWPYNRENPRGDPLLQCKGRLRDPRARILQFNMTFTHEGDGTAVYEDFVEKPKPEHMLYRLRTGDNPVAEEFAKSLRDQMSPELAEQYLEGFAMELKGSKIYDNFSDDNVRNDIDLTTDLPLQLSLDFNINPGMHGIVGQYDPKEKIIYSIHELYGPRWSTKHLIHEFVKLIRKVNDSWIWQPLELYGDATGDSKWSGTGESNWDIVATVLRSYSIPYRIRVPESNPHVADRVNAMNSAMRSVSGRIHYYIHERCELLRRDFKFLKWDQGEIDKTDRKLSHPSDADGYRLHYLLPVRKLLV